MTAADAPSRVAEGPAPIVAPVRIAGALTGYQPLHVLATALDLGVFTAVASGATSTAALVRECQASPRGLRLLVNALVAIGFLRRAGDGELSLPDDARAFLVEGTPSYLGGYVRFAARHFTDQWRHLTDAVVTGTPVVTIDDPATSVGFWDDLVDLLFPWSYPLACFVGGYLQVQHSEGSCRILDVGAGSGVWGIAAAQRHPDARVVALELPRVVDHARRRVAELGLGDRFEFWEADFRQGALGDGDYDVVILGQVCHAEGPVGTEALLRKAAMALRPGGTVVIADLVVAEDRAGPPMSVLYALTMLVSTREGETFSFGDYRSWLAAAGFVHVRLLEAFGQRVVVARRA